MTSSHIPRHFTLSIKKPFNNLFTHSSSPSPPKLLPSLACGKALSIPLSKLHLSTLRSSTSPKASWETRPTPQFRTTIFPSKIPSLCELFSIRFLANPSSYRTFTEMYLQQLCQVGLAQEILTIKVMNKMTCIHKQKF